jgi:hypothetical protein
MAIVPQISNHMIFCEVNMIIYSFVKFKQRNLCIIEINIEITVVL